MANVRFNVAGNKITLTFTQTDGGENVTLQQIADAVKGKMVVDTTLKDHPDDAGGGQSPRKILTVSLE